MRGHKFERLLSNHEDRFISWRICATRGIHVKVTRLLIIVMGVHTPVSVRWNMGGQAFFVKELITHWKHPTNLDIMPCFAHGEMSDRLERDRICYTSVDSQ